MPSFDQFIVWIVVGLIGGSLAGLLVTRQKEGFGRARNFILGLVGALVGDFLFRLVGFLPGLDKYAISLRDIIGALPLIGQASLWLFLTG